MWIDITINFEINVTNFTPKSVLCKNHQVLNEKHCIVPKTISNILEVQHSRLYSSEFVGLITALNLVIEIREENQCNKR